MIKMMNNLMGLYQVFMQNPIGFFMQNKINVPQNIANDPDAIIDYLMNNGARSQSQYNQAQQLFNQFKKR